MSEKRKFRCRIEELPVIAGFLLDSFGRDQADFESYSAKYGGDFIDSYREALGQVKTITIPKVLIADQKYITSRLHETSDSLRPLLLKIEGYIKQSKTLMASADDFGISELRNEIKRQNFEGVQYYIKMLIQMLTTHSAALSEEGLPTDTLSTLTDLLETIETTDLKQQLKMSEYNELVDVNLDICNELWEQMNALMDIGKRLYKYEHTYKLDDYTMETLKAKVNRQRSPQAQEVSAG